MADRPLPTRIPSLQQRYLLALALTALCPTVVLANAGTPLMWAAMFHLFFGNAILGIGEGLLLAWWFKVSKWQSVALLVAANYLSAWVGIVACADVVDWQNVDLTTVAVALAKGVLITFVLTLALEFPFVLAALRRHDQPLKSAAIATPAIHVISYLVLIGWYLMVSPVSMMTQLEVVSLEDMAVDGRYELYYLSRNRKDVMRFDFAVGGTVELVDASSGPYNQLFVKTRQDHGYDLMLLHRRAADGGAVETVLFNFAADAVASPTSSRFDGEEPLPRTAYGEAQRLVEESNWTYITGFWDASGIRGQATDGRHFQYALATPYIGWNARHATHIEGDLVVFQLGTDQICVLDPEQRRISLIARGSSPIVAVKHGHE